MSMYSEFTQWISDEMERILEEYAKAIVRDDVVALARLEGKITTMLLVQFMYAREIENA